MPSNDDFLLYPLDTGKNPVCAECGAVMMLAGQEVREAKPNFIIFRCTTCARLEKYICEE